MIDANPWYYRAQDGKSLEGAIERAAARRNREATRKSRFGVVVRRETGHAERGQSVQTRVNRRKEQAPVKVVIMAKVSNYGVSKQVDLFWEDEERAEEWKRYVTLFQRKLRNAQRYRHGDWIERKPPVVYWTCLVTSIQ